MRDKGISFLLFTFNEEKRVEAMLKCLKGHGEIVVIDNFSSDKTLSIAKKYTKNIHQYKNIGYVENKEAMDFATNLASYDWVYIALADELIPKKLITMLKNVIAENKYDAVEIYRRNFMYGQEVYNYGKHHLRMFKKGTVNFHDNIVHNLGRYAINAKVLKIRKSNDTSILHFSAYNTDKLELVHNRYANLEAQQRKNILGQKFSGIRAVWVLFFYFFGTYFVLGGWRGGWPGFFISIQIAYYKFSMQARLWELDNAISIKKIEETYSELQKNLYD